MEPRVFGNTLYALRGAAVLAVLISFAVSLCVYLMAPFVGTTVARAIDSALFGLGILAIFAVCLLPACLFSLRIDDTHISHLLVGKYVLSYKPLSQRQSIRIAKAIGAPLAFSDGTTIRFLGSRLEFLRDLRDYLQERLGGTLNVDIDPRAASSLSIAGNPRRLPDKSLERTREE